MYRLFTCRLLSEPIPDSLVSKVTALVEVPISLSVRLQLLALYLLKVVHSLVLNHSSSRESGAG